MLNRAEALQVLKEVLEETDRPDTDFKIGCSTQGIFWIVKPKSHSDYGTGIGHWLVNRETKQVHSLNPYVDPNIWEEMYLDSRDPTKVWVIRFDLAEKKGLIHLKNLLRIPLNEAKILSENPHWFSGHRVQLESARDLLLEKGIATIVEKVSSTNGIKTIKEFPQNFIFLNDVLQLIRQEDSAWWSDSSG